LISKHFLSVSNLNAPCYNVYMNDSEFKKALVAELKALSDLLKVEEDKKGKLLSSIGNTEIATRLLEVELNIKKFVQRKVTIEAAISEYTKVRDGEI